VAFGNNTRWLLNDPGEKINIDNRNLNLALDCLRVGKFANAEELLSQIGGKFEGKQFYVAITQAFLSNEKGRRQDVEACLDRAHILAVTEKERVYSGLLLARCLMLQGKYSQAKRVADGVIKAKHECYEARYLAVQIEVQDNFGDKVLSQLRNLLEEDRLLFMTALIDPHLMPIHGFVEGLQQEQIHGIFQQAQFVLSEAEQEVGNLAGWLPGKDERLQKHLAKLENLEEKLTRNSYFDQIDVQIQSPMLTNDCRKVMIEVVEKLQEQIGKEILWGRRLHDFWHRFPYKAFFGSFLETMRAATTKLIEAKKLLEVGDSFSFRKAAENHREAAAEFDQFKNRLERMLWIQSLIDDIKTFGKKLCLAECLMLLAAFLFLQLGQSLFSENDLIGKLLFAPQAFRKIVYLTGLLLAPILAMFLTIWAYRDRN